MRPRWHILSGAIFTLLAWLYAPGTPLIFLALLFFSSFLIDFDHYLASFLITKKWSLKESFEYHRLKGIEEREEIKKGIKRRCDFHVFHTIEFHLLLGALSFIWVGFLYIFIGLVFHSLLDLIYLIKMKAFHRREFFFFNWLRLRLF